MTTITTNAMALVAAAALALSACQHDGAATSAAPGQPRPRITNPAIGELLAAIPGNAVALGFLSMRPAARPSTKSCANTSTDTSVFEPAPNSD